MDNGVTSEELWKIIDASEDLNWTLFYYSGAASAAGIAYNGAVLGTPDGLWPSDQADIDRIERGLDSCGIKMWELCDIDNSQCDGAPLAVIENSASKETLELFDKLK